MEPQGHARGKSGIGNAAKWIGIGIAGLIAVIVLWSIVRWGYHRTVGYDLIGRWRAEQTSVLGFNLPVGANLEFAPDSALVLDTRLPVTAYDRDGNLVHVIVAGTGGVQGNFTFRFEDEDRIIFEGPVGVMLRYRRVKNAK